MLRLLHQFTCAGSSRWLREERVNLRSVVILSEIAERYKPMFILSVFCTNDITISTVVLYFPHFKMLALCFSHKDIFMLATTLLSCLNT